MPNNEVGGADAAADLLMFVPWNRAVSGSAKPGGGVLTDDGT